jgi:hypothetical protein
MAFQVAARAKDEIGPELKVARARVGSLTEMKRNKFRGARHLIGFQPLHFSWQP